MSACVLSRVQLLATPWTAAYQAPPSMGFSRQEYWSGVPLPFNSYLLLNILRSFHLTKRTTKKCHLIRNQILQIYTRTFIYCIFNSVQFSSVTQSCWTLCDPMNRSTPGLPVHHQIPEFTQTHVHRVSDAIQPPHPLASPSPPTPNPSQHQSLFQ